MARLTSINLPASLSLQEGLAAVTNVAACYQCRKCSGGCPLTFAMDLLPDRVIRLALLGRAAELLACRTIWVCSGCETCTTRCPNGIDIAGVMDRLKQEAAAREVDLAEPEVAAFYGFFLKSVHDAGGRLAEGKLVQRFVIFQLWRRPRLDYLMENLKLGWQLFRRKRLRLTAPKPLKGEAQVSRMFQKARLADL
jgi:heterodisulfide reductase subunit C